MEITPIVVAFVSPILGMFAVAAIFYGQINQFKSTTEKRLDEMEAAVKKLEEETASAKGAQKLFVETAREIKKQTDRIWEKLERMDDELKEIYRSNKK